LRLTHQNKGKKLKNLKIKLIIKKGILDGLHELMLA
jgi:hypothetical protein